MSAGFGVRAGQPGDDPGADESDSEQAGDAETGAGRADAGRADAGRAEQGRSADSEPQLRFSFESTPWRTVIGWLADQSGLALHVGAVPPGSFTYSDSSAYTAEEAIDRVNLFLIPQGFTLVRSGQLLSVISLEDPRSLQQLEAMAELVTADELGGRPRHDVVRCLFPLGDRSARSVVQELSGINLMTEPVIMPESNQLLITETAGKLSSVARLLDGIEPRQTGGEIVKRFDLEHQKVSDVLTMIRPHLGLRSDELMGIGLSLSVGQDDRTLYVTGTQETVDMIDSLVTLVDQPGERTPRNEEPTLKTHFVAGGDLQAAYEVMQTLFANEPIRLSMERESGSIVAFAPPAIQERIATAIKELEAPAIEFDVVPLGTVDPYFVISLLNEMFDIPTTSSFDDDDYDDDDDDNRRRDAPRIDADPANRRLFVRGKPSQIEQVRAVVAKLERGSEGEPESGSQTRLLPMGRDQAREVLDAAEKFWNGDGRVIVYPAGDGGAPEAIERSFHAESEADGSDDADERPASSRELKSADSSNRPVTDADLARLAGEPASPNRGPAFPNRGNAFPIRGIGHPESLVSHARDADRGATAEQDLGAASSRNLTPTTESRAPMIKTQVTPRGILIQAEDASVARQFEEHVRRIAGATADGVSPPVVFYLKYVKANDATRMLADLLDGAMSVNDSASGSLVRGYVSGPSSLGAFMMPGEETTTMTVGSATVVSDARLNRLIVQGTVAEIDQIERYLKIVDKSDGITSIETYGRSQVFELVHTDAEQVAEVIRGAFPGRITEAGQGGGRGRPQPNDERARDRDRDDDRDRGRDGRDGQRQPEPPKPTRSQEPMLALAVHPQSNSLVVTAPDPLMGQVEQLVRLIDERSVQDVQVIAPGNPDAVLEALDGLVNGGAGGSRSSDRDTQRDRSRDRDRDR